MADINTSGSRNQAAPGNGPSTNPCDLSPATDQSDQRASTPPLELAELLFFAYRDFTAEPDAVLSNLGFGRAHHRVLYFVNRCPGLRVADLLVILKITKQSLARVLKQLVERGFIEARAGHADRRERLLFVTDQGRTLARDLAQMQEARISSALTTAGRGTDMCIRSFLLGMVSEQDRTKIEAFIAGADELSDKPQQD